MPGILLMVCACLGDVGTEFVPAQRRCDTGYVFIDGVYLSTPYLVQTTPEGLTVNGRFLPGSNAESIGDRRKRQSTPLRRVTSRLKNGAIVIAFTARPLAFIESRDAVDFFRAITGRESQRLESLLATLHEEVDRRLWSDWLNDFEVPEDLRMRAERLIQSLAAIEEQNRAQMAAVRRIDTLGYPLSIVGMLASVLAVGHLLMHLPRQTEHQAHDMGRATVISSVLIGLFSLLDLAWTILAHQAGQMRELNPLGSGLIANAWLLMAFKASTTSVSCGILLVLRRRYIARLAAWWLCLVGTLLTLRWLLFTSMLLGS